MYPFEHQEFERSVRMEPQDIGLLPRGMWKYAGNSFLLHSYYAYHHILFVRKVRMEQRNCYLMLPGVYNPKEHASRPVCPAPIAFLGVISIKFAFMASTSSSHCKSGKCDVENDRRKAR